MCLMCDQQVWYGIPDVQPVRCLICQHEICWDATSDTTEGIRLAYLDLDGAHVMLQEPAGRSFAIGTPPEPLGQGLQLQIACWDAQGLYDAAVAAGATIPLPLEENWYPVGQDEVGQRHFVVADPDGYLLRFYEDLGQREAGS